MLFRASSKNQLRFSFSFITLLFISLLTVAQVNLKYRLLNGYSLTDDAPVNKSKPTLFVFEQPETFGQVFKPGPVNKRQDPNFSKEMIIGVAIPPTHAPPQLSISKVFVQDSTLTVRYISMADTTLTKNPQSFTSQPMLLLAIPKQVILKTRLIENGKVVQTIKKRESGE